MNRFATVFRPELFKGCTAIVTGGATGIGRAIVQELVELGCSVVISSRKEANLASAAAQINNFYKREAVVPIRCNIRSEDDVSALFEQAVAKFGKIDFLVNNGGGQFLSSAANISTKGFHAVVETNLYGTYYMCRQAFHRCMKQHGGVIINIIADMFRGMPLMAHSGAARAGVENLTRSLAVEWAEFGIRVNAVAPGSSIYSETAAANYGTVNVFGSMEKQLPTKRLGVPEEISGVVCFLLSPAASFVSGETVCVDGAGRFYSPQFYTIPDHNRLPPFNSKL